MEFQPQLVLTCEKNKAMGVNGCVYIYIIYRYI